MKPLSIFVGYDSRIPLQTQVLSFSIARRAKKHSVSITPLVLDALPITRVGLTQFTASRWLVPYLSGYRDWSLFIDGDVVCLCDIAEVFAYADPDKAVSVVQHEGRLRFERASLVLFNNELCTELTPDRVQNDGDLASLAWAEPLGSIPAKYNFLVEYHKPTPETPSIIHYTAGIPLWPETKDCDYAAEWHAEYRDMRSAVSWQALMGPSVHAKHVMERLARARASEREHASVV